MIRQIKLFMYGLVISIVIINGILLYMSSAFNQLSTDMQRSMALSAAGYYKSKLTVIVNPALPLQLRGVDLLEYFNYNEITFKRREIVMDTIRY